jgi:thiamine biosynthesis lipoprotein
MLTTPGMRGKRAAGMLAATLLNLHPLSLPGQGAARQFREAHMGLEVTITAAGPQALVEQAVGAAYTRIAELEQILSDWRPTSELSRLSSRADSEWRPVSPALESVLLLALEMARATDGAFDPTIGALTLLWREQRRTGVAPDPEVLTAARRTVGWRAVQLDTSAHQVRFRHAGTRLDFGGIAKGWILQQALEAMGTKGVSVAMIEAGGDLVAGDAPSGTTGWRVNVRTATRDTVLVIRNTAMATSGPSAQWLLGADGRRQSHVLDPTTGLGLSNALEATVLAPDGGTADAVATALTLVPSDRWPALLDRFSVRMVAVVTGDR